MEALALYDDTCPGGRDHYVVSKIPGTWVQGTVRGYTVFLDWGPAAGLIGFVPDDDGQEVSVWVITTDDLERHLRSIDDYEGPGYRRQQVSVFVGDDVIKADIYVSVTDGPEDTAPKLR